MAKARIKDLFDPPRKAHFLVKTGGSKEASYFRKQECEVLYTTHSGKYTVRTNNRHGSRIKTVMKKNVEFLDE